MSSSLSFSLSLSLSDTPGEKAPCCQSCHVTSDVTARKVFKTTWYDVTCGRISRSSVLYFFFCTNISNNCNFKCIPLVMRSKKKNHMVRFPFRVPFPFPFPISGPPSLKTIASYSFFFYNPLNIPPTTLHPFPHF